MNNAKTGAKAGGGLKSDLVGLANGGQKKKN